MWIFKPRHRFRNAPIQALLLALFSAALLASLAGCVFDTVSKGPVILFMGNSITLNAPLPERGWHGNWGMAATAEDSDYVHQTVRLLKEKGLDLDPKIGERECPHCD